MGTRIALVRHGETAWNAEGRLQGQTDIPLNEAGRAQARAAGERLAEHDGDWGTLVSSPLGRAVETATLIGTALGLEAVEPVVGLQERHYGEGEGRAVLGMPRPRIDELLLSAEPEAEVVDRGLAALVGLVREHSDTDLVVVAHGTLIRLVMSALQDAVHPRLENGEIVLTDTCQLENTMVRRNSTPVH
ncbi:MAG: histidine phosphatase family protein [Micrococcaceae bacterium]|nr:histidine phosphatase family protein [Micrococcaceae bacterium]MDN6301077.1 histidine phosphatase family protein [Micrococcaceae bacterium]